MSSSIKPVAVITGVGGVVGGIVGGAVGGPAGIVPGLKVGGALGVQLGIVNKGENAMDAAGRKFDALADKGENAIDQISGVASAAIEKVADVWSKMFLCGYAISIALNGANLSALNYNQFCKTAFDNLNYASMSLTTVSLNMLAVASGLALAREVYRMTEGSNMRTEKISSNAQNYLNDQVNVQKTWCFYGLPYAIGATICWGLSDLALSKPAETVAFVASRSLDTTMIGLVIIGAYAFWSGMNNSTDLNSKKIEMINIPKHEFQKMQVEIEGLKKELQAHIKTEEEKSKYPTI